MYIFFRFGPLRQHWCMRFESKNAQIKRFVSSSFRNVPLTVAIHHQQWICHQLATHPSQTVSNFFYSGDVIISGRYKEQCSIDQTNNCTYLYMYMYNVRTCRISDRSA